MELNVKKRNGKLETMSFDKILNRIKNLGKMTPMLTHINYSELTIKIIERLFDGIQTELIDELTSQQCAAQTTTHLDFGTLAARIVISNHQKKTPGNFKEVVNKLYNFTDIHGEHHPILNEEITNIVNIHHEHIQEMMDYERDFNIDYFGFKTLERAYLMKLNGKIIERPQDMWMRVAIAIHGEDLPKVKESYDLMSRKYFTHATPTLFNAGTPRQQMSSCYLLAMEKDSIKGIYNTLSDCASISKWAGGIGLHIHNIRASGTHIRGTNGTSNGIVPMLRVFNNTARYVDQCVTPNTFIYTTKGPMKICDTIVGETQIFNSKGTSEIIENILEHPYDGNILSIDTMHSISPLIITEEHPVYVLSNQQKGLNYSVIKNRLDKNLSKFEWKDAKNINYNDMIIYSIPKFEKDITNISADDCYFYGILLGDGSLTNNTTYGHITLHSVTKKHILEFIVQYFEKKCILYSINVDDNTTRIRWNKTVSLPFKYSDIYDKNKEKHIAYRWLNLPIEKSKYIMKGLIDTDGSKGNEVVFDSTSRNLIESMRYILLRMGILSSGYIRDRIGESHKTARGIIEHKKIGFCLRIPKTEEISELLNIEPGKFFKYFKYNDFLLTRVKNIENTKYTGTLYDLQMTETHNYMVHNGIIHNGGGRRNGSFAIYLEPWHADIENFLQMRKNHGDEEMKARDLFYALWIPDLFMKRVKKDEQWTLMCPDKCPGLSDVYGDEFETLYTKYEQEGKGNKTISARHIWFSILDSQIETGTPYMLYKDAANKKSNQQNLGTIKSSNLCVAPETLVLTDKGHIEIETLKDKIVNVWNGKEFSKTTIKQTSDKSELITITFTDGSELTCTKYHKFYIQTKYLNYTIKKDIIKSKNVTIIEAQDLKPNMKLIKCEYPIIDNINILKSAYTNGFFSGDGTYCNTSKKERKCNF